MLRTLIGHGPEAGQHMAGAASLGQPGQAIHGQALLGRARGNSRFAGRECQQVQPVKTKTGVAQLTQCEQFPIAQIQSRCLTVAGQQPEMAGQMHDLACLQGGAQAVGGEGVILLPVMIYALRPCQMSQVVNFLADLGQRRQIGDGPACALQAPAISLEGGRSIRNSGCRCLDSGVLRQRIGFAQPMLAVVQGRHG